MMVPTVILLAGAIVIGAWCWRSKLELAAEMDLACVCAAILLCCAMATAFVWFVKGS